VNTTRNPGRVVGLIYLVLAILAPIRLMYIPNKIFVSGDATATAQNIAAHELLYRFGIFTDLCCGVILIFLTLALYRLFVGVNRNAVVLLVIFGGVIPATIDFVNTFNDSATLLLVGGADYLSAFDEAQRHALAYFFTRLHHQVIVSAEILWGLWLWPLAFLSYRSNFMPKFIAVWLYINGAAYLIVSMTGRFLPEYESTVFNLATPAMLGELAFTLWLLIKGARPPASDATPAAVAA